MAASASASLEDAIKATQESFKGLIRKPPMTEKLLSRPPFRYLHDILMELTRKHKFLNGLYSGPELESDTYKDKEKDGKIAFLQKCLDAMVIMHGRPMPCKVNRMVSGQEPEKTNEFLQLIAQTVSSKQDTQEAVKYVLGKTKSKDGDTGKGDGAKTAAGPKESSDKKGADRKQHRSSRDPAATEAVPADPGPSEAATGKDDSAARLKDSKGRRRTKDEEARKGDDKSKVKEKDRPRRGEGKPKDDGHSKEEGRPKEEGKESKSTDDDREKRRADRRDREGGKEEKGRRKDESGEKPPKLQIEEPAPAAEVERPSSPKSKRRVPRSSDSVEEGAESAPQPKVVPAAANSSMVAPEPDFLRPPLPPGQQSISGVGSGRQRSGGGRPSSARPAPPKIRSRQNSAGSEEALSRVSSNVAVQNQLVMDDNDDDDADDMFVVENSFAPQPTSDDFSFNVDKDTDPSDHGLLVRKILESKKELEPDAGQAQESAVTAAQRRKRREKTEAEVNKLRESIQTLCRSANPLAKAVDYIQEDVESMLKELKQWQAQAQTNSADLSKEKDATESELEPLREALAQLDAGVEEQMELIGVLKANIAKNDQQMSQLVNGIALSCRQ